MRKISVQDAIKALDDAGIPFVVVQESDIDRLFEDDYIYKPRPELTKQEMEEILDLLKDVCLNTYTIYAIRRAVEETVEKRN